MNAAPVEASADAVDLQTDQPKNRAEAIEAAQQILGRLEGRVFIAGLGQSAMAEAWAARLTRLNEITGRGGEVQASEVGPSLLEHRAPHSGHMKRRLSAIDLRPAGRLGHVFQRQESGQGHELVRALMKAEGILTPFLRQEEIVVEARQEVSETLLGKAGRFLRGFSTKGGGKSN